MPNFSEIATAVFDNVESALNDIGSNNVQLYKLLAERKRVRPFSGGEQIRENLIYQGNGTYTRYTGSDTININPARVVDAARYPIKQVAVSINVNGLEQLQTSDSESRIFDFLESKLQGAEIDFVNGMGTDVHSDGTGSGGKQLTGLQALVADSGAGTVGGIDSSVDTWWKNIAFDCTTDGGAAATSANIQGYINRVMSLAKRAGDSFDFGIADNNYYNLIWESLSGIARLGGTEFKLGPDTDKPLVINGVPIYLGGGKGGSCPANHIYLLNSKYLSLRPHTDRNFTKIGDDRYSINQDGMVRIYGWAGNLTCSNRSLQAVIKD